MTDSSFNVDHHLAELQQVAAELRAGRAASPARHGSAVSSLRTALGRALLAAATALLSEPGTTRLAPR
jgi:hypothetical protein